MRRRDHTSHERPARGRTARPSGSAGPGAGVHRPGGHRVPSSTERHSGAIVAPLSGPGAGEPAAKDAGSGSAAELPEAGRSARRSAWGLWFLRYGIGLILVLVGIVLLIVDLGGFGPDGFGIFAGCGLSVILLNYLYRIGVSGDEERRREEEARRYLAKHGRWPD